MSLRDSFICTLQREKNYSIAEFDFIKQMSRRFWSFRSGVVM